MYVPNLADQNKPAKCMKIILGSQIQDQWLDLMNLFKDKDEVEYYDDEISFNEPLDNFEK